MSVLAFPISIETTNLHQVDKHFCQNSRGLPVWEIQRDHDSIFPANVAALASMLSKYLSDFSAFSSAGDKSFKSTIQHSRGLLLGKIKTQPSQSETVISPAGQAFKPKEPRRGRRIFSAARVANLATPFKT
jgi:hypothetical protein